MTLKIPFFDARLKQLNQVALMAARDLGKQIYEDDNTVPRAAHDAVILEYLQMAGLLEHEMRPNFFADELGYIISAADRQLAFDKNDNETTSRYDRPVYQITQGILYPNRNIPQPSDPSSSVGELPMPRPFAWCVPATVFPPGQQSMAGFVWSFDQPKTPYAKPVYLNPMPARVAHPANFSADNLGSFYRADPTSALGQIAHELLEWREAAKTADKSAPPPGMATDADFGRSSVIPVAESEAQQQLNEHLDEIKVPEAKDLLAHLEAIWRFLYARIGFRPGGTGAGALVVLAQAITFVRDKE